MKLKKAINTLALTVLSTAMFSTSVFAMTFKDVPKDYWGYSAIDSVSNKGLMVGDLNNNFRPNAYIDRFETSIVLARLIGYKSTGASAEEEAYYTQCYNNQIGLISQYQTSFTKWGSYANREIAYLLEKGVLTSSDLNHFVYRTATGGESINVLTKEDIAVFLVRCLNATDKANALTVTNRFADDADIELSDKSSVYYLRSIGIVSGDNNNKYYPKNPVRRAEMATLLDKTYSYMYGTTTTGTGSNTGNTNTGTVTTVTTVTGTIDTYYESLSTLQVTTTAGQTSIYVIDPNATISVDGYSRTKADLKKGMYCILTVESGKTVKDIKATSATVSNNGNNTNTGNTNTGNTNNNTNTGTGTVDSSQISGTAAGTDAFARTIKLTTKTLSPKGEVLETTTTYNVVENTPITKSGQPIYLGQIATGDIVTCNVNGNYVSNLVVEQKNQNFTGKVIEKGYDDKTKRPYFIINNSATKEDVKLYVGEDSELNRENSSDVSWNIIKVGDSVTVSSTFGVINELNASGDKTRETCYVRAIYIAENGSYLMVSEDDDSKELTKYFVESELSEIYDLKIGSEIKIYVDSNEIYDISILSEPTFDPITGEIQDIYRDRIVVENEYGTLKTIYYDESTRFINSTTGAFVSINNLYSGDVIYAIFAEEDVNIATTITIIKQ